MQLSLADKRLIVVDDRDYASDTLAARLHAAGAQVELCRTIDEWHHAFRSASAGGCDAVFLNTPLAGSREKEITQAVANLDMPLDTTILLHPSDTSRSAKANTYALALTKPVMTPKAVEAVERVLSRGAPETASPPVAHSDHAGNILLVEDSEANSMLIELYLKDTNHRLTIAKDGWEALELFIEKRFDIVFMDIEMPVMDGFECTERMRHWERANGTAPTAIVALTAHALEEVRDRILAAGCDGFLTKPIVRKDFLHAVERNCQLVPDCERVHRG